MKNYVLLFSIIILACSCKKSSPASTTPKITIQSAIQTDHSGVTILDVTLNFENAPYVSSAQLVIYKTDVTSINYKYDIIIKDGVQVVSCSQYATASPMIYQIKYILNTGAIVWTDPASQAFN